ncbi:MAG TPA: alpha/beta hydrolase [Dehalococcoidia bacterium]|nr:alpha/beta hydrolase [Dehalococcoidia bacterium]
MFEEREEFITRGDVRIWTAIQGIGIPLILCNGGPGCADYLGPVAGMIDDLAQVIRFEQRGCGRSDHTLPYDLETCLYDLESIRKHYDIDKWIMGGHSWGANLALAYALEYPDNVLGLLYIAGNGIQNDREWSLEYHMNRTERGETSPPEAQSGNDEVNRLGNESWHEYIKKPDLLKRISELEIPALFIHGTADIRPGWPGEQIASLMPNAVYETIDAEHFIWLFRPDEMKYLLRNFIKDINPG